MLLVCSVTVHWVRTNAPSIIEPGGNSSMISRARVHARARKAGRVRGPRILLAHGIYFSRWPPRLGFGGCCITN
jgi:hypothetical protein